MQISYHFVLTKIQNLQNLNFGWYGRNWLVRSVFFPVRNKGVECTGLLVNTVYSGRTDRYGTELITLLIRGCQWHHGPCVVGLEAEGGTRPFFSGTISLTWTIWPALISWFLGWGGVAYRMGGPLGHGVSPLLATYFSLTTRVAAVRHLKAIVVIEPPWPEFFFFYIII